MKVHIIPLTTTQCCRRRTPCETISKIHGATARQEPSVARTRLTNEARAPETCGTFTFPVTSLPKAIVQTSPNTVRTRHNESCPIYHPDTYTQHTRSVCTKHRSRSKTRHDVTQEASHPLISHQSAKPPKNRKNKTARPLAVVHYKHVQVGSVYQANRVRTDVGCLVLHFRAGALPMGCLFSRGSMPGR